MFKHILKCAITANLHLHSLHIYRPLGISRSSNSDPKKKKEKKKAVASVSFQ
jgi:hypothetical protein